MRLRRRATRTVQHVSVEVDIGTFSIELVLILNLIRLCLFKSPSDGFLNPIPNQVLLIPVLPHRVEKCTFTVVLVTWIWAITFLKRAVLVQVFTLEGCVQ